MLSPQGKLNNVKLNSTDNSVLSSQMKKVEESKVAFWSSPSIDFNAHFSPAFVQATGYVTVHFWEKRESWI